VLPGRRNENADRVGDGDCARVNKGGKSADVRDRWCPLMVDGGGSDNGEPSLISNMSRDMLMLDDAIFGCGIES
jgi:hypothetical protein